MAHDVFAIAILSGAGILGILTILLFLREHNRRLAKNRLNTVGRGAIVPRDLTPGDSSAPAPVLSPWLAAASLVLFGGWIAYDNAIDDTAIPKPLKAENCAATFFSPREARATSVFTFDLKGTSANCAATIRSATLVVDGTAVKEALSFVMDGKMSMRSWLMVGMKPGVHRVDVLTAATDVAAPLSLVVSSQHPDPRDTIAQEKTSCETRLVGPRKATAASQWVPVVVDTTCSLGGCRSMPVTRSQPPVPPKTSLLLGHNATALLSWVYRAKPRAPIIAPRFE